MILEEAQAVTSLYIADIPHYVAGMPLPAIYIDRRLIKGWYQPVKTSITLLNRNNLDILPKKPIKFSILI